MEDRVTTSYENAQIDSLQNSEHQQHQQQSTVLNNIQTGSQCLQSETIELYTCAQTVFNCFESIASV